MTTVKYHPELGQITTSLYQTMLMHHVTPEEVQRIEAVLDDVMVIHGTVHRSDLLETVIKSNSVYHGGTYLAPFPFTGSRIVDSLRHKQY